MTTSSVKTSRPARALQNQTLVSHDRFLRPFLLDRLRRLHPKKGTIIAQECDFFTLVRLDVGVWGKTLDGFEIKAAQDDVWRFTHQMFWYDRVLDKATLVTTVNHQKHMLALLPRHWGLWLASEHDEKVVFEEVRPARQNPKQEVGSLVGLLPEALQRSFLAEAGYTFPPLDASNKKRVRGEMHLKMQRVANRDTLRALVRHHFNPTVNARPTPTRPKRSRSVAQ